MASVHGQGFVAAQPAARQGVHEAKVALDERGPVWWDDGAKDYNRHLLKNSPYAAGSLRIVS